MLNLKTRFILDKKKHTVISEMFWCNILRRAGSDYYVNNFPGTFVDFRLKKFIQEIIVPMLIHVRKIVNCKVSVQSPLPRCLLIVAKELWT